MGVVQSNSMSLGMVEEYKLGEVEENATLEALQPNSSPTFGSTIGTESRSFISPSRQQRKGTVVSLESSVSVEQDLTVSTGLALFEGALYSTWDNKVFWNRKDVRAAADGFVVKAGVLKEALPEGTLIYAQGFSHEENNGIKLVSGEGGNNTYIPLAVQPDRVEKQHIKISDSEVKNVKYELVAGSQKVAGIPNPGGLGRAEKQHIAIVAPDIKIERYTLTVAGIELAGVPTPVPAVAEQQRIDLVDANVELAEYTFTLGSLVLLGTPATASTSDLVAKLQQDSSYPTAPFTLSATAAGVVIDFKETGAQTDKATLVPVNGTTLIATVQKKGLGENTTTVPNLVGALRASGNFNSANITLTPDPTGFSIEWTVPGAQLPSVLSSTNSSPIQATVVTEGEDPVTTATVAQLISGLQSDASYSTLDFTLVRDSTGILLTWNNPGNIPYTARLIDPTNKSWDATVLVDGSIRMPSALIPEQDNINAHLFKIGLECPENDISIGKDGEIISGTTDFEKLGLQPGSWIYLGGETASTSFNTPRNNGICRIRTIERNKLYIDKYPTLEGFVEEDGAGKNIRIFTSWFLRNVPIDDLRFNKRSYTFELTSPGIFDDALTPEGRDGHEYSFGNVISSLDISGSTESKVTMSFSTFGQGTTPILNKKKNLFRVKPFFNEAFSSVDMMRAYLLDGYHMEKLMEDLTSISISINNNVEGQTVLGQIGPKYVNYGNLEISISVDGVFTNPAIIAKTQNNCTVSFDFMLLNNDGAFVFDAPTATLSGGERAFEMNSVVTISSTVTPFAEESTLPYTLGLSFFPYMPSQKFDACK